MVKRRKKLAKGNGNRNKCSARPGAEGEAGTASPWTPSLVHSESKTVNTPGPEGTCHTAKHNTAKL